jgi:hypothetical protein
VGWILQTAFAYYKLYHREFSLLIPACPLLSPLLPAIDSKKHINDFIGRWGGPFYGLTNIFE